MVDLGKWLSEEHLISRPVGVDESEDAPDEPEKTAHESEDSM